MSSDEYQKARRVAESIAAGVEAPRFYREQEAACARSRQIFSENRSINLCLEILRERQGAYGHGLSHAEKVAIDAGAIVIVEESDTCSKPELMHLVFLAHLAGLLHDIERSQANHAHRGALEARNVLQRMDLPGEDVCAITDAIRNHEAFQPCEALEGKKAQLLSDALYDADKFRWGPDNFTEMLWDMLTLRPVPLSQVMKRFLPGLEGIEKIRYTFRSETGKRYGPDFIDRGINIGHALYEELTRSEQERRQAPEGKDQQKENIP